MKTKEYEVYVHDMVPFEGLKSYSGVCKERDINSGHIIKARLIIELPEKKKEFTKSEIEQSLEDLGYEDQYIHEISDRLFNDE